MRAPGRSIPCEKVGLQTLRKLLTAHMRTDRFVEGHLAEVVENGQVVGILRRMRKIQQALSQPPPNPCVI